MTAPATPAAASEEGRHLLVVDDDDRIRDLLKTFLARRGFRVTGARDAASARRLMATLHFDLMVLDVMMPGEDGFSLAASLPPAGAPPVLMLTARGEPADRIRGLSLGVDDYLPKPFEPQELVLRIEAILRRAHAAPARALSEPLGLGACRFDPVKGLLTRDGAPVRLTEGETALLQRLARTPDQPVDRGDLMRPDDDSAGRGVDVAVTRLRRKIEPDAKVPRYLQTVRGVGYMLAPD
ncbi:MAG: response regulator transcription factor [Caulobacteraceae bacterium]|nr:response regulator transcription factor [Caulobacter sp.]